MARRSQRTNKKVDDYYPKTFNFLLVNKDEIKKKQKKKIQIKRKRKRTTNKISGNNKRATTTHKLDEEQPIQVEARRSQRNGEKNVVYYPQTTNSFEEEVDEYSNFSENSEFEQEDHPISGTEEKRKLTTSNISAKDQSDFERETTPKKTTELSEYEKQILLNIEERKKMFEMIVGDAKKDLMKTLRL